jgi:NTP pyrophosphatase (non-canonical NTP hydrolase)
MNKLQQLMVITMEECGELTQVCSKTIRKAEEFHQIDSDQRKKLLEEAGDVYAMIQLMVKHNMFSYYDLELRAKEKHKKLSKWSNLIDEPENTPPTQEMLDLRPKV